MGKTVAVIQSNYIPWKGYFDIIHDVDLFIFYDDVQFTRQDWRSRNQIKTPYGLKWLSIPVGTKIDKLINEVILPNTTWRESHLSLITQSYSKTPFFQYYKELLDYIYKNKWTMLSEFNQSVIKYISQSVLGIKTEFLSSEVLHAEGKKQDRLMDVLKKVGATTYVSGPAAKDYIDELRFQENNINLIYKNYDHYPEYKQVYPPFTHYVSILDLLFHVGPDAPYYIWGWREEKNDSNSF